MNIIQDKYLNFVGYRITILGKGTNVLSENFKT